MPSPASSWTTWTNFPQASEREKLRPWSVVLPARLALSRATEITPKLPRPHKLRRSIFPTEIAANNLQKKPFISLLDGAHQGVANPLNLPASRRVGNGPAPPAATLFRHCIANLVVLAHPVSWQRAAAGRLGSEATTDPRTDKTLVPRRPISGPGACMMAGA